MSFNQMAASLQTQIRQLEELSRVQRRFVSDVSHELRTPLTTVRMAGDVLHDARERFDPPTARAAELLQNELDRFELLLSDLLEISRFDAGAAVLDLEDVDLVDLAHRVVRLHPSRSPSGGASRSSYAVAGPTARASPRPTAAGSSGSCATWSPTRSTTPTAPTSWCSSARTTTAAALAVRDHGIGLRAGRGGDGLQPLLAGRPGAGAHHAAAPGWGCRSRWRTPACTAAGCRPGASPAPAAQFRLTLPRRAGDPIVAQPAAAGADGDASSQHSRRALSVHAAAAVPG